MDLGAGRVMDSIGQVIAELESMAPYAILDKCESNILTLEHS